MDQVEITVSVTKTYHVVKGEAYFLEPKSERSWRTVSIPPSFAVRLGELRREAVWVVESGEGKSPIMVGHDGTRAKPDAFSSAYYREAKRMGVDFCELKNLRHSQATIMLESGIDVVNVSRRLGHSSVSITDAFYLRPRRAADAKAADAFDSMGIL